VVVVVAGAPVVVVVAGAPVVVVVAGAPVVVVVAGGAVVVVVDAVGPARAEVPIDNRNTTATTERRIPDIAPLPRCNRGDRT
jgi:hypothetical protein